MTTYFYIAGPIFGKEDQNEPEFRRVASLVREALEVNTTVPHDIPPAFHSGRCPEGRRSEGATHNEACNLRSDIKYMLQYCEGIVLMQGWHISHGARLEMQVATACGLRVFIVTPKDEIRRLY